MVPGSRLGGRGCALAVTSARLGDRGCALMVAGARLAHENDPLNHRTLNLFLTPSVVGGLLHLDTEGEC